MILSGAECKRLVKDRYPRARSKFYPARFQMGQLAPTQDAEYGIKENDWDGSRTLGSGASEETAWRAAAATVAAEIAAEREPPADPDE